MSAPKRSRSSRAFMPASSILQHSGCIEQGFLHGRANGHHAVGIFPGEGLKPVYAVSVAMKQPACRVRPAQSDDVGMLQAAVVANQSDRFVNPKALS